MWGLFFIATREEKHTPKLKAREFIQPVKEIIRRRSLSVDSGASASKGEERPHWESAFQGNNPPSAPAHGGVTRAGGAAAAVGFPIMIPVNDGSSSGHHRQRNVSVDLPGAYFSQGDLYTDQCEILGVSVLVFALFCVQHMNFPFDHSLPPTPDVPSVLRGDTPASCDTPSLSLINNVLPLSPSRQCYKH